MQTPAHRIIHKFTGTRPLARSIKVPPTTVQSWKNTGLIPAWFTAAILQAGASLKDPVTPDDFIPRPDDVMPARKPRAARKLPRKPRTRAA